MLIERPIERTLAVVGLAGVALIHLLDLHDTFVSTPYKGWLYVALISGSLLCAGALLRRDDSRAWTGAVALPLGAFAAFIWSRTVGLPGGADDISNWWEPLGLSSLFVEGVVVALGLRVLAARLPLAAPAMRGLQMGVRTR
jgi:hypothetical protein